MRRTSTYKTGFIMLLLGITTLWGCAPIPEDVTDEIAEANKKFMAAFNSGDAALLADCYTADGKLLPPGGNEIVGLENIRDYWQGGMNMGLQKVELLTLEATGFGNTAVEEGRYTLYAEGDVMVGNGKYIVTWHKDQGQWKLHKDIWNASTPPPMARAVTNDTVWVVWNNIKAEKIDDFEQFNSEILEPATREYFPAMRNTVRLLRPVEANEDGSWTYFYLMDPASSPEGYDMLLPLEAKFGKEMALKYLDGLSEWFKDGKQHWVVAVQTEW